MNYVTNAQVVSENVLHEKVSIKLFYLVLYIFYVAPGNVYSTTIEFFRCQF